MSQTLIQADDTITLWGIIIIVASLSIFLEQRFSWAAKMTGAIIALLIAILLSNTGVIPTDSAVYDSVWAVIVPLAIPLLLFHVNIKKLFRESGRLLLIFLISSIGTIAGTILAFFLLKEYIPLLNKLAAMFSASYIGGGVNFAAMAAKFETPGDLVSSAVVADNLNMALLFVILMVIPTMHFFRSKYKTPHIDLLEAEGTQKDDNLAKEYWKAKEISLKDIALSVGTAFALVILAKKISGWFDTLIPSGESVNFLLNLANGLIGDQYLMLTTLTFLALILFPKFFDELRGSQEIGTYLIHIFFVVIGIPASIPLILENAPLLLVFAFIIVAINLLISLVGAKVFKFELEETLLAVNANIGGPTTAAALAIAKGWRNLVGPILIVGTLGYIIGNYVGTFLGLWLEGFM